MSRHEITTTLSWMREGEAFLRATVDRVPDEEFAAPSGLPGWTRAHVVGHVARNAEALFRLSEWARTGIETPMYEGHEQRTAEIEASARQAPASLRQDLVTTAHELDEALQQLDATTWQTPVRSARGRQIPAVEIPWIRVREVWLHAIDLAAEANPTDLPHGLVDVLLDDVTGTLPTRDNCPALVLKPNDRDDSWQLGAANDNTPIVTGMNATILSWLVGRDNGSDLAVRNQAGWAQHLPKVPKWL